MSVNHSIFMCDFECYLVFIIVRLPYMQRTYSASKNKIPINFT